MHSFHLNDCTTCTWVLGEDNDGRETSGGPIGPREAAKLVEGFECLI